jgi:hypothetical protein
MSEKVELDEADRLLIALIDTAIEVGTGRTFDTPAGLTVRVGELGATWVYLEVMERGVVIETHKLPRDIRRIAVETARLRALEKAGAFDRMNGGKG